MTIKIHNLEEMKDYYNEETNTYTFWGDDGYTANVILYFDLKVDSKIFCHNLLCDNIDVLSISAYDIDADIIKSEKIICHNIDAIRLLSHEIIITNDGDLNVYGEMSCHRIKAERII